ncbi:MAG: RdgB/HAM1 family non-canonical purine NTP pyrophosphatase [Betaproteobacteria bacterium]|nr:MAG: RdgB/HAM1 family non-canonical purine NTP pyrophosphatase [Betaproteobacteria bacterium]TMH93183.1 MAG: RdgB/HAM1 family non-canonical purine NTP pyrophosphatase [Betaproteobacteria bacterium]
MKKLVLASSNPGKLREFEALLAPLGMEVVAQASLGVSDADEPHGTFVENALAKARHASRRTRFPALADDSGICVEALGGEPGVHSARFAGEPRSDARNNEKLVKLLAGKDSRRAHYYCVVVFLRHAEDPEPVIAEGIWAGEIVAEPRGANGFGYDPHFFLRDFGKTAAELDPEQKNLVSHRGKALRRLLAKLKEGV